MEDADDLRAKVYHQNLAGAFNQALMELGATICVPNGAPLCTECPWKDFCEAKKQELIGQIPVKSKAKPRKIEKKTVLILRDDEKMAILEKTWQRDFWQDCRASECGRKYGTGGSTFHGKRDGVCTDPYSAVR